jgi:hypothetical protein
MNILKNIKTKKPILISNNAFLFNTNKKIQIHHNHIIQSNDNFYIEGDAIYKLNDIIYRFNSKDSYEIIFDPKQNNNFRLENYKDIIIESNKFLDLSDYNFVVFGNANDYKVIYYNNDIDLSLLEQPKNIFYDYVIYNKTTENLYSLLFEFKNLEILNYNFLLIKSPIIDLKIDNYKNTNYDNQYYYDFEFKKIIYEINTFRNNSKYNVILGGSMDLLNFTYFMEWINIWLNEFTKPGGRYYKRYQQIKNQPIISYFLLYYRVNRVKDYVDMEFIKMHKLESFIKK